MWPLEGLGDNDTLRSVHVRKQQALRSTLADGCAVGCSLGRSLAKVRTLQLSMTCSPAGGLAPGEERTPVLASLVGQVQARSEKGPGAPAVVLWEAELTPAAEQDGAPPAPRHIQQPVSCRGGFATGVQTVSQDPKPQNKPVDPPTPRPPPAPPWRLPPARVAAGLRRPRAAPRRPP